MANIELSFPGADRGIDLSVRHFDITEGLSRPFEAMLVAASRDPDLDFELVLGKPARCHIDGGPRGARVWEGVCSFIEQIEAEPDGLSLYSVRVVPRLWLLTHRRGHRVFQHKSTPEIARALLGEWGIEVTLRLDEARFPKREYRVQYGESDLSFVSRLLEDAGISYFFEDAHLILTDAPERGEPRGAPALTDARIGCEVRPGGVVIGDFNFQKPLYRPSYQASAAGPREAHLEHQMYAPGVAIDDREGQALAARTLDALREGRRSIHFSTDLVDLAPGVVFAIDGANVCVAGASLKGNTDDEWTISASAVFCDAPVRPAKKTARPRLEGVQSAVVVGPKEQDIHVDEFGRVRLRFHWDREGERDAERTPWVRVAEGWAGAGFGMMAAPRVGQEVLVTFLDGDPEEPMIVGRTYNASAPPPHALPAAGAKSVWRSRSSPGSGGSHEIAFDDRHRHELIHMKSERDLEKVVQRDEIEDTGEDREASIGRHLAATVGGEDTARVGGGHVVSMTAGDTRREIVGKRITLTTGSATILLDGRDITVTAQSGISIKAGGTVSIQGEPYVHINPPHLPTGVAKTEAPPPDHLVWFKLVSEGKPLAGARCHIEHEDGSSSETQMTDGNGLVRLPVDKEGSYHLKLGTPPSAPKETAKETAPAEPAAPVIHVGKTPAQPAKNARATEHEVPIKLEIIEPKHGHTFHTHSTATMPHIPLKARVLVNGEPTEIGSVRWEFRVSGKYRVRTESGSAFRLQDYKLPAGHTRTAPNTEKKFELAPADVVGGDLEIKAVFHGGPELGNVTASKTVHGCKVLGKNAARHDVEQYIIERAGHLAWLYLRMFCHESAHTLEQFAQGSGGGNAPGFPLYGPPAGVGIVQRDPTAGEWHWHKRRISRPNNFFPRIFWNWEKNVNEGITSFTSDYIERGRRDLDSLRHNHPHLPMYPEGVLLRAAIRRYNGGIEFGASSDGRHYVVSPTFTNNPGYVDSVLNDPHINAHKHPVPAATRARVWPH